MRPCLDDLREQRPDLSLALYAMTPGGPVTLEIYSGGEVYPFKGATAADAILAAFPQQPTPPAEPVNPTPPDSSVFD